MLACCAHYLTNVLPVLGVVGAATLIAQYQTQLFWISLTFNAAGLLYIGRQVLLARKAFIGSPAC
jgi:Cu+-exporting ATPase